jgi:hypothetical protein
MILTRLYIALFIFIIEISPVTARGGNTDRIRCYRRTPSATPNLHDCRNAAQSVPRASEESPSEFIHWPLRFMEGDCVLIIDLPSSRLGHTPKNASQIDWSHINHVIWNLWRTCFDPAGQIHPIPALTGAVKTHGWEVDKANRTSIVSIKLASRPGARVWTGYDWVWRRNLNRFG